MVRTPCTVMGVCLPAEGGEEKGGYCCGTFLLIIADVPNAWYEIGTHVCSLPPLLASCLM